MDFFAVPVTPFGLMRLLARVVRERGAEKGGYLTLSKALLKPKATRLLSPWIEKRALEAATCLNCLSAAKPAAWTNRKCVFRKFKNFFRNFYPPFSENIYEFGGLRQPTATSSLHTVAHLLISIGRFDNPQPPHPSTRWRTH